MSVCAKIFAPILLVFACLGFQTPTASAVEIVFLKSGSSLLVESHADAGDRTEVLLLAGAKVYIENSDIDRITVEESSPIQVPDLEVDPEKLLPETSDPLNWWLDARPQGEGVST